MPATQRPWAAEKRDWRGEESEHDWYIRGDIQDDDEGGYATGIAIVKGNATSGDIAECNARLIVNAVNCHDDLLDRVEKLTAALKMVKDWCELNRREGSVIYKPVTDALKYIK